MKLGSMRLSLRFVIPLVLAMAGLAYLVVPVVDTLTVRWFVRDLDTRSRLLGSAMQESLAEYIQQGARTKVYALFMRAIQDERLYALALCDDQGKFISKTPAYPDVLGCAQPTTEKDRPTSLVRLPQGPVHVASVGIDAEGKHLGTLMLVHDMNFIELRSADTKKYIIGFFVVLGFVISLITVFVAHLSWRGWVAAVRGLLRGEGIVRPFSMASTPELQPLAADLRALVKNLDRERQIREDLTTAWTPDTLRMLLRDHYAGDEVIVVSNREPYLHENTEEGLVVKRPASGLVTAVEPVMRACSGTWIAHGSGSGDRLAVDKHDHVRVPPDMPSYNLRRIWLTEEEERGYYYGFANEGLWPLCHIAHVRPVFRSSDWEQYVAINQRFADAVVAEARTSDPVVLVQDYHFALLPRLVREALPKATIITFWHIPWPNPESFGICPWREEILEGMLGSTILGFHTRYHCKNFFETVDRYLEARIEQESSTISYGGRLTAVEPYPISIQWPAPWSRDHESVAECRVSVRKALGLPEDQLLGVGVDRLDYTKGIVERFLAIEELLVEHPELVGRFTFVQIAAPTRSTLEEYQEFDQRVRALAERVNHRFGQAANPPILLKVQYHGPEEVNRYYRAADACVVTSLHDGMNLVAKEFIAARDDEQGVLVLSQFTGAAYELHEALLVNPYHIEQCARALHRAVTMSPAEQRERMKSLRRVVQDFNIFRWAGRMLVDAARLRQREHVLARIRAVRNANKSLVE